MTSFSPANRPIDVTHYKIRIEIDPSRPILNKFPAEVEITLKTLAPIDSFTLDRDELTVAEVWQVGFVKQPEDNQPLEFDEPTQNPSRFARTENQKGRRADYWHPLLWKSPQCASWSFQSPSPGRA